MGREMFLATEMQEIQVNTTQVTAQEGPKKEIGNFLMRNSMNSR